MATPEYKMKVIVAKQAGFCFGVRRAIETALQAVKSETKIEMLGDIVHNEDVVNLLAQSGIKKIKRLRGGKNKTLLIRAHGAPRSTYNKARALGYRLVDATCPMVKEIHKKAREMERKGRLVIIIGDKKHDEVKGITGQLEHKALIIEPEKKFAPEKIKNISKAAVLCQSTQELDKVLALVEKLKNLIPGLEFFNTVCNPTRLKQKEIKIMAEKNQAIVVIGSKNSANTKRLFEISRKINKKTFWIQNQNQINREWFKNVKTVGITAGASTPDNVILEVRTRIKAYSRK